ncbi:MAG: hypothetical protein DHS20C02_17560 [Micavibrio sp.]|nr:MAG: hypothetical protein DHS20C02_17560 [Micavibrio sp.]
MLARPLIALLLFLLPASAMAGEIDISGFVGAETRVFTQSAKQPGQESNPEASLILNPEFRYKKDSHQFSFIPFYRLDSRDHERSHFDIREAYWLYAADDWEFLAGLNKIFWGVTESRHLVDIINQTDAVEDLDGEDKLGQPMLSVTKYNDWGQLDFYALPGFRERTFPGSDGRFRGPLVIDTDNARYESSQDEKHVDFAARYSHYFGDWDVGLSHFYGTVREPRLVLNGPGTKLEPHYDIINQTGTDIQYTKDAWLWKFEGIVREGQGETFAAATGGFEYTFYQVFDSAADIGALTEYHYDGRHADAAPSGFDNDVFAGVRLALNDIQDTAVLAGFSIDPDASETFYNLEAERRIGDNYEIEFRARFFTGADPGESSFPLEKDDYIQIRFARYF